MTDDKVPAVLDAAAEPRPRRFADTELISCPECERANPPTRANCLYCGAQLPLTEHTSELPTPEKPAAELKVIEMSDPGFLILIAPGQARDPAQLSLEEIAKVLQMPPKDAESAVRLNCAVPLMRTATSAEATTQADSLRGLGLEVDIFPGDESDLNVPNKKTRSLVISADALTAIQTTGERTSIGWEDLSLMVSGRLLITRKETDERKRLGRPKQVDDRELFSDEPVVDLYRRFEAVGWRISANSFDFSCLGEGKAITAFENLTSLISLIKTRAPGIEFDDAYPGLRPVLNNVWPLEPQTRPGDWRRRGVGKVDVSTVTIIDNEDQFNAYSRLRQRISLNEREGGR